MSTAASNTPLAKPRLSHLENSGSSARGVSEKAATAELRQVTASVAKAQEGTQRTKRLMWEPGAQVSQTARPNVNAVLNQSFDP